MTNVSHVNNILCNRIGCETLKNPKYNLYCSFECAKFVYNDKQYSKEYQRELKEKVNIFLKKQPITKPQIYFDDEQIDD